MATRGVLEPRTDSELASALSSAPPAPLAVLFFFADFHAASRRGGPLDDAFALLASSPKHAARGAVFVKCDAEALDEATDRFAVDVVPTFVFVGRGGAVLDRVVRGSSSAPQRRD